MASWQVSHLQIEWPGFEPWLGTLCCVHGKTLYFHIASLNLGV